MRIDSHQHFWRYDPARDSWITDAMSLLKRDFLPPDLSPELQRNGMDFCIAVQAAHSESETQFLLDLAASHDFIAGVVGWVDLCAATVRERLWNFSLFPKLRGFRHIAQAEPDDRFLVREDFLEGIDALAEFGFTYDILIYPRQLSAATELVAQFPDQRFVLDHIAKPPVRFGKTSARETSWAAQLRLLASYENVCCKVSGLITEADWHGWRREDFTPYLDVVFESFGPDRLMFGSDWPVCLMAGSYAQVKQIVEEYVDAHCPAAKDKIFGGNAARFYGLQE